MFRIKTELTKNNLHRSTYENMLGAGGKMAYDNIEKYIIIFGN
jgi:hypothetical protein